MKKQKTTDTFQKYTVIFGYALFISIILLEIIGAGLFINNLSAHSDSPMYPRYVTVITLMSLSAILPPLLSYFAGELSTKKKLSALTHHFNGILFAGTAFIVWLLLVTMNFGLIIPDSIAGIPGRFMQFWPALATIIIMLILAISYAKSKTRDTVLSFKPFAITLLTTTLGSILIGLYSQIEALKYARSFDALVNNALPGALNVLLGIGMLVFAYYLSALRQHPPFKRAAIAATIALIGTLALGVFGQVGARFMTHLSALSISLVTLVLGLSIWLFYLYLINSQKATATRRRP